MLSICNGGMIDEWNKGMLEWWESAKHLSSNMIRLQQFSFIRVRKLQKAPLVFPRF